VRRWIAAGVVVAGLAAWIAAGALSATSPLAAAQTPPVQIERVQHAEFVPAQRQRRPLFILALGSDAREGVCEPVERCLSDSIHIIAVNTRKRAATILGFPRDSYVPIPGHGSGKINEALHDGGPELVVDTVQQLTGIPIDYYMLTSFEGLPAMVDAVGGITVNVPYPMHDEFSGTDFDPGPTHLSGHEALQFSRDRHSAPNGDFNRSENQGSLMLAALAAMRNDFSKDPASLFTWIVAGVRNISTDLSFAEIFDLALTALSVDPHRVTNLVVPGGLGFVGDASVVHISPDAERIYEDLKADGLIRRRSTE
jgi:LCP family protein required for cell wall assembly